MNTSPLVKWSDEVTASPAVHAVKVKRFDFSWSAEDAHTAHKLRAYLQHADGVCACAACQTKDWAIHWLDPKTGQQGSGMNELTKAEAQRIARDYGIQRPDLQIHIQRLDGTKG